MARKQPIRAVKGMRDILPPESALWNYVEETARKVFRAYAYQEIRTPLVEPTELFARGVGADTDIVTKEMYTWEDRDKSSLTLRPEATASVIRAYIVHRLDLQPGVKKFYYMGPMFRRERPQKGRYRQFYQIGAEAIGSESPAVDAELIEMLVEFLDELRLVDCRLLLNSVGCKDCRPKYLDLLRNQMAKVRPQLCADCQRRSETNPLRVLDCKVPADQPIIDNLPTIADSLCEACLNHFQTLQGYLQERNISYTFKPRMVRGLDYYTRTTFEFISDSLGAQNSLLGGGRYDGLAEELGGPAAPGIGFSIGEDRLALMLRETTAFAPFLSAATSFLFIAWEGDKLFSHASELARDLRGSGVPTDLPPGPLRLSKSLELAAKLGCRYTLIVREKEFLQGEYTLRDMFDGKQWSLSKVELVGKIGTLREELERGLPAGLRETDSAKGLDRK